MAEKIQTEKIYKIEEVAKHNTADDCWLVIESDVYDVTKFLPLHPAGKNVILKHAGKDATEIYNYYHGPQILHKYKKLIIGKVEKAEKDPPPLKQFKGSFGDLIPFGDPNYVQGWCSPFYNETHHKLREALRKFFVAELEPNFE